MVTSAAVSPTTALSSMAQRNDPARDLGLKILRRCMFPLSFNADIVRLRATIDTCELPRQQHTRHPVSSTLVYRWPGGFPTQHSPPSLLSRQVQKSSDSICTVVARPSLGHDPLNITILDLAGNHRQQAPTAPKALVDNLDGAAPKPER